MDGSAVLAIERIVNDTTKIERDGLVFSPLSMNPVIYEPRPSPVKLHTLSGLVEYIRKNVDELDMAGHLITVNSPFSVSLISKITGLDRERDPIAAVNLDDQLKTFPFGQYQQIEAFVVGLRSMFEATEDLEKLVVYVSKVSGGKSFTLEDDGVSQTASVKTGVSGALTRQETAPAIVKLRPFRTFRDIEQTESEFLFRMKLVDTENNVVGACLYEADGGRWRHFSALSIKKYLDDASLGVAVIA